MLILDDMLFITQLSHIHSLAIHHYISHQKENHVEIVSMLLKKENIDVNIQENFVCNIFIY